MPDILTRLRERAHLPEYRICDEAADEIQTLRYELGRRAIHLGDNPMTEIKEATPDQRELAVEMLAVLKKVLRHSLTHLSGDVEPVVERVIRKAEIALTARPVPSTEGASALTAAQARIADLEGWVTHWQTKYQGTRTLELEVRGQLAAAERERDANAQALTTAVADYCELGKRFDAAERERDEALETLKMVREIGLADEDGAATVESVIERVLSTSPSASAVQGATPAEELAAQLSEMGSLVGVEVVPDPAKMAVYDAAVLGGDEQGAPLRDGLSASPEPEGLGPAGFDPSREDGENS